MDEEKLAKPSTPKRGPLYWFDGLIKKVIPNFNVRAILYFSVIFGIALYVQIWRISSPIHQPVPLQENKETVIADEAYWESAEYKNRMTQQTPESFALELENWLNARDQELTKRRFEDMLFINTSFPAESGSDAAQVVPESFNYLENIGRARYRYAKEKGFVSDTPSLTKIGTLVCDLDERTERVTGIDLYDWRYASMPKLAAFMATKPDWKIQVGGRILDVSETRLEDKDLLKLRTPENQPAGLFSFLVFHDPQTKRVVLSDAAMLEKNGIDANLTLSRIDSHWDKQPKLYFTSGYGGCQNISLSPQVHYGHSD